MADFEMNKVIEELLNYENLDNQERKQILDFLEGRNIPIEEWKSIPGTDGLYEISNYGRARSWNKSGTGGGTRRASPRILKGGTAGDGYITITISTKGVERTLLIHRLVAEAFVPNPGNKPEVNHKLTIKTFNWAINLEWSTRSENLEHSYENGKKRQGESHGQSKLTETDILDIRNAYALGCFTYQDLSEAYNVHLATIARVVNRETWAHV